MANGFDDSVGGYVSVTFGNYLFFRDQGDHAEFGLQCQNHKRKKKLSKCNNWYISGDL